MTPFRLTPTCSKCGGFAVRYKYYFFPPDKEFLNLTCLRCAHIWEMEAQDKAPSNASN